MQASRPSGPDALTGKCVLKLLMIKIISIDWHQRTAMYDQDYKAVHTELLAFDAAQLVL